MDPISMTVGGLSALGVGGAIQLILRWKFGGKKTVETQTTVDLTATAMGVVSTIDGLYKAAVKEAQEAKVESAQAKAANDQLRREFDAFREEIGHVIREETSWATAAVEDIRRRTAAAREGWPANLAQTPPILTLIPGRN